MASSLHLLCPIICDMLPSVLFGKAKSQTGRSITSAWTPIGQARLWHPTSVRDLRRELPGPCARARDRQQIVPRTARVEPDLTSWEATLSVCWTRVDYVTHYIQAWCILLFSPQFRLFFFIDTVQTRLRCDAMKRRQRPPVDVGAANSSPPAALSALQVPK